MNTRTLLYIIIANLLVLTVLTFAYPHLMISPGQLTPGHAEITNDCFSCHTPLWGSTPGKCISCHEVDKIGLFTVKGIPIVKPSGKERVPFHQDLIEQNCVACHSDHLGVSQYKTAQNFTHKLLNPSLQARCESCHKKPDDNLHTRFAGQCNQCHGNQQWKPAKFDHALAYSLDDSLRNSCESCHKTPSDSLHQKFTGQCNQCHSDQQWKPANFNHDKAFFLDKDHNAECTICHLNNDFKRYTCYGCHEHRPEKIYREHIEEGIRDYENCVECHRSARDKRRRGESFNETRLYEKHGKSEKRDKRKKDRHDDDD